MKKILFIAAALVILAALGIGILVATFDINRYKGALVSQLESATGNKVEIGHLSLAWKGAILLGIKDFKIYTERDGQKIELFSFERAEASAEPAQLLMGRLYLSSISVIRPNIHLIRMKDAVVEIRGYRQRSADAVPSGEARSAAKPIFGFNIGSIDIKDGTVRFQDMMSYLESDIMVRKIEAQISPPNIPGMNLGAAQILKNISATGAIRFNARMAVASERQNIAISGTLSGFAASSSSIKDCDIEADLAAFDHDELMKALPILAKTGFIPGLGGLLKVKIRALEIADNKVSKLSADLSFTDGKIALSGLKIPVERINLSGTAEGNSVTVKSFSVQIANGSLSGKARIDDIFASPRISLQTTVEVQGVKSFIYSAFAQKQNMDGNMRLTFDGTMTGVSWPEISKTLAGGGVFSLDRGVIDNSNILNQTLSALTLFPGLPDMVKGYVPAPIQQAFGENNTVIRPLRQSYTIESGYVMLPNVNIETDTFDMRGDAKSSLTGDISGSGIMRFAQSVSVAMIKSVPEMKYITDSQGMVEFPMAFKSGENGFKVIPDLKYVGQKVAVQKAGEMVTDFLKKAVKEDSSAPPAQGAAPVSGKPPKLKDLITSFMQESR